MATVSSRVESLRQAVRRLPAQKRRDITRRLTGAPRRNGSRAAVAERSDASLIETAKLGLTRRELAQIKRLSAKCRDETITDGERRAYMRLVTKAEELSVVRVEALAELARRRGKSLRATMKEIGWKVPSDD